MKTAALIWGIIAIGFTAGYIINDIRRNKTVEIANIIPIVVIAIGMIITFNLEG